jgi:hypothetical protein
MPFSVRLLLTFDEYLVMVVLETWSERFPISSCYLCEETYGHYHRPSVFIDKLSYKTAAVSLVSTAG